MTKEMLDVLDNQGRRVGEATRAEVHRQGWWHRTFHCWLLEWHAGHLHILLQQRDALKKANPGLWDVTAAGHLEAGEDPLMGVRELEEELGVKVAPRDLYPVGVLSVEMEEGEGIDREFQHVYLAESPLPINAYRLQAGEVAAICRVPLVEVEALIAGKRKVIEGEGFRLKSDGRLKIIKPQMGRQDWVVHGDIYFTALLHAVRTWAKEVNG